MKNKIITTALITCLAGLTGIAQAEEGIADKDMGLSKQSVFEVPTPDAFNYQGVMPGTDPVYKRAYPGAPPQIPHNIELMTPVKAGLNYCLSCHGHSAELSQPLQGMPTPIPVSHYTDLRNGQGKAAKQLVGARYVCTQCHVPQANVKPLVKNKF
ncbi:MAG TPA: cytochrome C [Candidatus Tenderia electrophaga]|uniref:Periplasmic nitrate reductase, electron transfer subunit n=1 Tax=Candidatus Tenderia electrophaga TaxID=1748243 RepID=A0A832J2M7_9GAMM|nr:cytochrome C [Candidatus Tenderia electrophaga]